MKIFVISDLHIGPYARSNDFRTQGADKTNVDNFISEFQKVVDKEGITADYLIIAGDISNYAEYEEFEVAAKRIQEIANILNISHKKIFFVPGNHDANWKAEETSLANKEPEGLARVKKYVNLQSNSFFSGLLDNSCYPNYYKDPYASIWEDEFVIVVGINSSAYDSCDNEIHHGEVRLSTFEEVQKKLDIMVQQGTQKVKILLTHHHPINYSDRTFKESDLSMMKNSEDFISFSNSNDFDFIVHGHKHVPNFKIQSNDMSNPVNILCAGSFSAMLSEHHNGVPNCFHIIEIENFCSEAKIPRGQVSSWSYFTANNWGKSKSDRDGISHRENFGTMLFPASLKNKLSEIISNLFESKDFARSQCIVDAFPDIKYCPGKSVMHVLQKLAIELQFEIQQADNNEFILWSKDAQ
ncbi:metallophosphoesterase [Psychromonas sp. MME2]|uniref:metallophosphoesterase family protein n=1 Tax=unclassified Psychromonas TaxID=2614957 RepID=UPI00339BD876